MLGSQSHAQRGSKLSATPGFGLAANGAGGSKKRSGNSQKEEVAAGNAVKRLCVDSTAVPTSATARPSTVSQ